MVEIFRMSTTNNFVSHVRNHIGQYGFKLIMGRGKQVNVGNARCEGFFLDSPRKEIRIAKGNKTWLDTLAHEYGHFLQWLECSYKILNTENNASVIVHNVSLGYIPRWYTKEKINMAFLCIADMERECEMRTVRIIRQFKLPIDKDLYVQRANLYVYMHHMWKKHQTRKTKINPWRSKIIISQMPKTFNAKSHIILPSNIAKELNRCFL